MAVLSPVKTPEVVENTQTGATKRRGRPKKVHNPHAEPMTPVSSSLEAENLESTVDIQSVHLNGTSFVHGNMMTQLTRGKNGVQEMQLVLSSGLLRVTFGATSANKAATIYLPASRYQQVQERAT